VLGSQTAVFVWFIQIVVGFIQNLWLFFAILASSTITILATMISILRSNRKFPWKEVPRCLKNVFWPNISMNFLLENKLGVCRDYAKMTACLLSNIYPNAEIYFASAPGHVATGINIENRLYMLDQRLPILTIDRWNDYRKPKKSDTIERFDPIKKTLHKADKRTFLQTKDKPEPNTEKLAKRMTELLNIKEQPDDKTISLQKPIPIPWKNGARLYEENEMTDYSLARFLAKKISSELVKISQITKIETSCDKDDLIFQIHVSKDK
jgi:predicted transglutaminase-like protease